MSDEVSFDVYVIDSDGEPAGGEEVGASFSYSFWPGTISHEYTDSDGHAYFSSGHPARPLTVELYVRGQVFGPYSLEDGAGFTIEL